jgi:hypothetical protein
MKNTQKVSDTDQSVRSSQWEEWLEKIRRKPAERWIIAVLLGGIAISWLGTPESGKSQSILLRLSIPVMIIAIYAWYGYKGVQSVSNYPALRNARVGQLADSVYFLGFLWTLWALIDSFVLHHLSIAEAVFRAFGYALVTTASGMFLRLTLLQFSYSAEDQVPLSEQEIEKEIGRFSNAIGNGIMSLDGFKEQTDAALSKWIDSINKSTEGLKTAVDNVSTQTTSLKDALVEMQKTNSEHVNRLIESALSQFAQKMQTPLEAVNINVKKMEKAVNDSVKEIDQSAEKGAEQIQTYTTTINDKLAKSTEAVEKATTSLADTLSKQMRSLVSNLADVSKQIKDIHVSPDIVERTFTTTINDKLAKSTEAVEKATTSLSDTLSKQMRSLVSNLADVATQIKGIHVSPDIVEKTLLQQVTVVNESLIASTRALQKAIDGLSRSVLDATNQIRYNDRTPWWDRLKIWK